MVEIQVMIVIRLYIITKQSGTHYYVIQCTCFHIILHVSMLCYNQQRFSGLTTWKSTNKILPKCYWPNKSCFMTSSKKWHFTKFKYIETLYNSINVQV